MFTLSAADKSRIVSPVLKYVGGKTKLLPELIQRMPGKFAKYHEPFTGGGAMFFALAGMGLLNQDQYTNAYLSDANPDVINLYKALAWNENAVIQELQLMQAHHRENPAVYYINCRQHRNSLALMAAEFVNEPAFTRGHAAPDQLHTSGHTTHASAHASVIWAALTLYLNRTCYNGLWRVNKRGAFNVPLGDYDHQALDLVREETLRDAARVLGARHVEGPKRAQVIIRHCDFLCTIQAMTPGDFVYFDPPYLPISATAKFTNYAREGFGDPEQRSLANVAAELAFRGVHVMVSQADTPYARELYAHPLLTVDSVEMPRAINSKADKRGKVGELIITSRHTHE